MKNKKVKVLILVMLILLAIILIHFTRNAIIIKSLANKVKELKSSELNNYNIKWTSYSSENTTVFDIYYKDGLYKKDFFALNYTHPTHPYTKVSEYKLKDGSKVCVFEIEKKVQKYDKNDEQAKNDSFISINSFSHVEMYTDSVGTFIKNCLLHVITKDQNNGEDVYKLKSIFEDSPVVYFSCDTGLTVRSDSWHSTNTNFYDTRSDILIEFDCVSDEDIMVPNLDGYTNVD